MRVTILCSDDSHPVNAFLKTWIARVGYSVTVELVREKQYVSGGDLLFLISCTEIVTKEDRSKYSVCLVLHASDLPRGRGWSPHIWELCNGANGITLSLLEAEDAVDSGRIWKKIYIPVPRHFLWNEINNILFQAELELMSFAVENFSTIEPEIQSNTENATYYNRRQRSDSQIDPTRGIAEQFDLIRICDPHRYPAYFDHLGHRYLLKVEKYDEE